MNRLAVFRLVLFVAGPAVLLLLTPAQLESIPDLCVWKLMSGRECWGCGMTHAFLAVLRADFAAAMQYNPRVIVAFPLIALLAARSMWRDVRTLARSSQHAVQR